MDKHDQEIANRLRQIIFGNEDTSIVLDKEILDLTRGTFLRLRIELRLLLELVFKPVLSLFKTKSKEKNDD